MNANVTGNSETGVTGAEGKGKGARNRAAKTESAAASDATGAGTTENTPVTGGKGKGGRNRAVKTEAATTSDTTGTGATENTSVTGGKGKRAKNARTEAATTNAATGATPGSTINPQENLGKGKRGQNARMSATPAPTMSAATANAPSATVAPTASVGMSASTATTTNATANQTNVNTGAAVAVGTNTGQIKGHGRNGKQVDPQFVQKIKTEHASFRAQPRPDRAPPVTFQQNYRLQGADQWQGPQYEVFRRYHPERHDRNWYGSNHFRVELIGGGYYYWNNGYWYPAWGYDPSAEYYAYDAPIYVGHSAEPPDKVIADVQATLQQMGYYQGEVDGLLGPLTRQALAAYQADHGLYTTEVIDEPTLQSLGMA
jgi:hypothetical protein